MIKRTLVFTLPVSLKYRKLQLVAKFNDDSLEEFSCPVEDLGCVIIDNPMITVTVPLINALADNNVSLIFCDGKSMPNSILMGFENNTLQGEILRYQLDLKLVSKKKLWKDIIENKIRNQSLLLEKLGKDNSLYKSLYMNVKSGDIDNREGLAAKLYWGDLFGNGFKRDRKKEDANCLLNYGYTVLRAAVSRAILGSGLFPSFGVFHKNRSNAFPLSDDLMEPYRPFIDEIVYALYNQGMTTISKDTKRELVNVLNSDCFFKNMTRPLSIALTVTTASYVKFLKGEVNKLNYPVIYNDSIKT